MMVLPNRLKEHAMYEFIGEYNDTRDAIYEMTCEDPSLMGDDAWLVHAMMKSDMTLITDEDIDFITVRGMAYTMQTMDHEWFEFDIKKSDLELFQLKKLLGPAVS